MTRILLAGFGGQGVLFGGKFLATLGLAQKKEVSWLPSYGPEMRGGTANCSVIIADERIGSPIVTAPDILVCMNLPSLDKFEDDILPGGMLFADSSLVTRGAARSDITAFALPATQLALDSGVAVLANMLLVGKVLREAGLCGWEEAVQVMRGIVPEKRRELLDANLKALKMGYDYGT